MKIFIFSYENINRRSINQLHKNLFTILEILANFGKTLAKEVKFVTLPGLLANSKNMK